MKLLTETESAWTKAFQEESYIAMDADFETHTGSIKASGPAATILAVAAGTVLVIGAAIVCKESGLLENAFS